MADNETFKNLSLTHLKNLQEASELSGNDIVLIETAERPNSVNLRIEEDEAVLSFIEFPNDKDVTIALKDYTYIISCISLE